VINLIKSTYQVSVDFNKKKFYILFLLILLNSFLELISVGIFIPAANFFLNNQDYFNFFSSFDYNQKIFFFTILIILIFLLKFIFFIIVILFKNEFILKLNLYLSNTVLKKLINKPLDFHILNSSAANSNTVQQVNLLATNVSMLIYLAIDIISLIAISIFLLLYEFHATIVVFTILTFFGYAYYIYFKKKMTFLGEIKFNANYKILKNLQNIFIGIKEIKIFRLASQIGSHFVKSLKETVKSNNSMELIILIPKYFLEFLIIVFLTVFLIILIMKGYDSNEIISKIAISGFAFYKLLPMVNRLVVNFQGLNSRKYAHEKIVAFLIDSNNEIDISENHEPQSIRLHDKIEIKNLSFAYKNKVNLFNDLTFEIKKGDIVCFFGPSGSGKTTLINLISGFLNPSNGTIFVDGKDIKSTQQSWNESISYVSQNSFLFDDTIEFNITLEKDADKIDRNSLIKAMDSAGIESVLNQGRNLQTPINEMASDLSGGQKQRIGIARALYKKNSIFIFDEPTSALDKKSEIEIIQNIIKKYSSSSIILVTHREYLKNYCNKVLNFDESGKIKLDI